MSTDTRVFCWVAGPALALVWGVLSAVNAGLDALPDAARAVADWWWTTCRLLGG